MELTAICTTMIPISEDTIEERINRSDEYESKPYVLNSVSRSTKSSDYSVERSNDKSDLSKYENKTNSLSADGSTDIFHADPWENL